MKKPKKVVKKLHVDGATMHAEASLPETGSLWREPFIHILLVLITGFAVYANSMSVQFMFDDFECILGNPAIKDFSCFPDTSRVNNYSIGFDLKNNIILRPVVYFTFALNYAIHGAETFGYHLVNLLFHIGSAMLVYVLFSQLLNVAASNNDQTKCNGFRIENWPYLPLFAALLFVCHPLQTQAVTYIIQRFVPLATFFYLASLTLYAHFRSASEKKSRNIAYFASICAAVLAMESKEIAFTLPLIIVLFEFMFFNGIIKQRVVRLIPILFTLAIIPIKLIQLPSPVRPDSEEVAGAINLVNFSGVSSWDYLMTQFGVIMTYVRLLFLPVGQNFDYDYPLQQSFFKLEVLIPLALILVIIAVGVYLSCRSRENSLYKICAFGIFWFFITLSVESSIVPIDDLIFEHRVYLPAVGFFIAVLPGIMLVAHRCAGQFIDRSKVMIVLPVVVVFILSAMTIARNRMWQNPVTFWQDVIKKSPNKARPYEWLGESYTRQVKSSIILEFMNDAINSVDQSDPRVDLAIAAYKEAIRLRPTFHNNYTKVGEALLLKKDSDNKEAEAMFEKARSLAPKDPWPLLYLGAIREIKGDLIGAQKLYEKSIELQPLLPNSRKRLVDIYRKQGDFDAAIKELEYLMKIFPEKSTKMLLEMFKNDKKQRGL